MIERKLVHESVDRGRKVEARLIGPDLLCYVDGTEMPGFFLNVPAAVSGAKRYIDEQIKVEREKAKKAGSKK